MQGDLEAVLQGLSDEAVLPNGCDEESMTALHWAAAYNEVEVLRTLLRDERVQPNVRNKRLHTPLHQAVMNGAEAAVQALLEDERVDKNAQNEWGESALVLAASAGEAGVAVALMATGVDRELEDKWGQTAEDVARAHGEEGLALLIREGHTERRLQHTPSPTGAPTLNSRSVRVLSKLMEVPLSDTQFAGWLQCDDIDVNGRDMFKWTALHKLASWNKYACLMQLLADPRLEQASPAGHGGNTPLHTALEMAAERCALLLLDDKRVQQDVDKMNDDGRTALHFAVLFNNIAAVERLLAIGASPYVTSRCDGKNPWQIAHEHDALKPVAAK